MNIEWMSIVYLHTFQVIRQIMNGVFQRGR